MCGINGIKIQGKEEISLKASIAECVLHSCFLPYAFSLFIKNYEKS
jgi:hypothetical protein